MQQQFKNKSNKCNNDAIIVATLFGIIVATTVSLFNNCSYMAKTKPIGVRFDEELLNKVKEANIAASPQKALNLYEKSYVELVEKKLDEIVNTPEVKSAKKEMFKKIVVTGNPEISIQDLTNNPKKSNYVAKVDVPPMPERMIGEDALDFAGRKSEWKKKYNQ